MSKFKVGDEVIAYNKSYGIIKDLGEIGCLITFKDKTHHVQYPDIKKSPHQELLDLGWEEKFEDENIILYEFDCENECLLTIHKDTKEYFLENKRADLQLAKILVRYLEELE